MRAAILRDGLVEHSDCDGASEVNSSHVRIRGSCSRREQCRTRGPAGPAETASCNDRGRLRRAQADAYDLRSLVGLRAARRTLILDAGRTLVIHCSCVGPTGAVPLRSRELCCKIGSVAAGGRGVQEPTFTSPLRMRSADSNNLSCALPPAQHSQLPCAGISAPSAIARKCATSHRKFHGGFGVAVFEFAIRGAHAAESLDPAGVALALARLFLAAERPRKLSTRN